MTIQRTLIPTRAVAALGLALASLAAQADVASITQSGGFGFANEVHSFDLDIATASDLRLWTSSFAEGQLADPLLAFFDRNSGLLLSVSDDVDAPFAQVDPSQGQLDAGMHITDLAAGQYRVAISVSPNYPAGFTWAEGYLQGTTGGNSIDSGWTVRGTLSNAAPVPEPTSTALLLAGLAAVGWLVHRRSLATAAP